MLNISTNPLNKKVDLATYSSGKKVLDKNYFKLTQWKI